MLVGSWMNLTFMPVVFANMVIGIIQELRSKKTLDKLSILNTPKSVVIREGTKKILPVNDCVRDDIAMFTVGNQIYADAIVVEGECQVNEALMTGERTKSKKPSGTS
jgi:cation-transporting ATPase E